MLEHQKIVLNGVSEDKSLFKKELLKSLAWLNADEQEQLGHWVRENFKDTHKDIINDLMCPNCVQAN